MTRTRSYDNGQTCLCVRQDQPRWLQSQSIGYTKNFNSRKTRLDQRLNSSRIRCDFDLILAHLFNPLNAELNPICCLLALLGAHHFLHVSRIRVKSLTLRLLMSYIYGAPILDVSRSHTTTQHSR